MTLAWTSASTLLPALSTNTIDTTVKNHINDLFQVAALDEAWECLGDEKRAEAEDDDLNTGEAKGKASSPWIELCGEVIHYFGDEDAHCDSEVEEDVEGSAKFRELYLWEKQRNSLQRRSIPPMKCLIFENKNYNRIRR